MKSKSKANCYQEGGDVEVSSDVETSPVYRPEAEGADLPPMVEEVVAPAPKEKSFKEAFAEARADGDKTFTWKGKSYTTQTASDSKPSRSAGGSGGGRGPSLDELNAYKSKTAPSASRSSMLARMRASDAGIKGVRGSETAPSAPRGITKIDPTQLKAPMRGMGGDSGMKKGGSVKGSSERATGYRGYGIAKRV